MPLTLEHCFYPFKNCLDTCTLATIFTVLEMNQLFLGKNQSYPLTYRKLNSEMIAETALIFKINFNLKKNIMKNLKSIAIVAALLVAFASFAQNSKDKQIIEDAKKAKKQLIAKDAGLKKFFETSTGYVIFPNVGEGGFILGGASGNGVVYENGKKVGMAEMKKIDVGLQAGGQALTEVIFFETEDALNEFKTSEYTISGDFSAVAVKSGVSKNANYNDGVIVFTMPKAGLMADASVGGQKFEYVPFK